MKIGQKIKMSFRNPVTNEFTVKKMTITDIRFKHNPIMFNIVIPMIYLDDLIIFEKSHLILIQKHIKDTDYRFAWVLGERLSIVSLPHLSALIILSNEFSIDELMDYDCWYSPVEPRIRRLITMGKILKNNVFFSDFNLNEFINCEIDKLRDLKQTLQKYQ